MYVSTKTQELCIRELLFAADAAIVAHTLEATCSVTNIPLLCSQFVWLEETPGWLEETPGWLEETPGWLEETPGWLEETPGWLEETPGWLEETPGWLEETPAGAQLLDPLE